VLDPDGNVLPEAAEVLGKEGKINIAKIAKIAWISRKEAGKLYG
jgi:hypothetical protein